MRVLFFLLWSINAVAQPPAIINIAKDCSEKDLKNNLYYLAGPALEGRMMGSHGDTMASRYVADWFKANGLKAPYGRGKSYYQDITVTRQTDESTLSIGNKDYDKFNGWEIYPPAPIKLTQLPVLFADYDDLESLLADLPKINVKGKAMIVSNKAFLKALHTNIDSIETILKNHGLLLLVWYNGGVKKYVESSKAKSFIPEYVQNPASATDLSGAFPELGLSTEKISALLNGEKIEVTGDGEFKSTFLSHYSDLNVTIGVEVKRTFKKEHAPNIIGVIPGADTSLPCIVVSAHHDHDGINGKEIYYGAVDNASGTATIMQLATMMKAAIAKGLRPKRTIVFASFTGEERGLLGSFYYADHPLYPMQQTYANINLDMLGRVDTFYSGKKADSNYVYILVKDSVNRQLREKLYKANSSLPNLKLDTYYENPKREQRRLKGSDQYPLFLKGVPFVRIDCGFCSDYHKPTDTPDKINYPLLRQQTQLAFLTLWNIAND